MPLKDKRIGRGIDTDFIFEVSKGNVPNHLIVNKFGNNAAVASSSVFAAVWNGGGDYRGFTTGVGGTLDVWSTSPNDNGTSGGGGARTVELHGLSTAYAIQTETITLNGTAPVASSQSFIRCPRAIVKTAGSSGTNIGTIIVTETGDTGINYAKMPQNFAQTMIAAYTIPADKTGWMFDYSIDLAGQNNADLEVRTVVRPSGEVFQTKETIGLRSAGNSAYYRPFALPKGPFTEKTDIKIMANSGGTVSVSAAFSLMIVDN